MSTAAAGALSLCKQACGSIGRDRCAGAATAMRTVMPLSRSTGLPGTAPWRSARRITCVALKDAHVHADHLVSRQRHYLAVLDHIEQPRCSRQRHVADLVQEQSCPRWPAGSCPRCPLRAGAGECARLGAEQFALDQRLGMAPSLPPQNVFVRPGGWRYGCTSHPSAGFPSSSHRDVRSTTRRRKSNVVPSIAHRLNAGSRAHADAPLPAPPRQVHRRCGAAARASAAGACTSRTSAAVPSVELSASGESPCRAA